MVVRLRFLSEPMRYDEAKVFLLFGSQPLDFSLGTYDYPGNQIFHTLLQHVSVRRSARPSGRCACPRSWRGSG